MVLYMQINVLGGWCQGREFRPRYSQKISVIHNILKIKVIYANATVCGRF